MSRIVQRAVRTFANPILPGFHPDPSICRVGGDFYLVTSTFEYFPGIPVFHSLDLVHWELLGHVLTRKSQLDLAGVRSSDGIYAPTIRFADGRYYVITTVVRGTRSRANFYVTADDPRGPWSDPVWLDEQGFDPSLLFADGQVYYQRDGAGPDRDHPRVYQTTLDVRSGRLEAPPQVIWSGAGGVWPEGAHVYKIGARYYLLAAEGGTGYGHRENVARADTPFGPYAPYPRNPILSHRRRHGHPIQATGHADLVDLPDGTTWAVFLGVRARTTPHGPVNHLGRETFLAPVRWTPDGWPVIGRPHDRGDDDGDGDGGTVELQMDAPDLPPHPFEPPAPRDDFASTTLGPGWMFVRNPVAADLSLTERPGFARLNGSAVTLDQVASPAAIVRRQDLLRGRYRAALDFVPRTDTDEAGLTVRADESNHYELCVRRCPGQGDREALLIGRLAGVRTVVARTRLAAGAVTLEVAADETRYRFSISTGDRRTTLLGFLPTEGLSAEHVSRAGHDHFTGTVIGLYATGNGVAAACPADFDWFEGAPL